MLDKDLIETPEQENISTIKTPLSNIEKTVPLLVISICSIFFFMIFLTHIDVGFLGEGIRTYATLFLGNTASLLPFCGLYWLLERYMIPEKYHNKEHSTGAVIIGFIVFILCSSTLASLVGVDKNNGGFWGLWTADILLSSVGFWGASLINVLLIIFSLSLFISVYWRLLFIATGMKVLSWQDGVGDEMKDSQSSNIQQHNTQNASTQAQSFIIHKPATTTHSIEIGEPNSLATPQPQNAWRQRWQAFLTKLPLLGRDKIDNTYIQESANENFGLTENEPAISSIPTLQHTNIDDDISTTPSMLPPPQLTDFKMDASITPSEALEPMMNPPINSSPINLNSSEDIEENTVQSTDHNIDQNIEQSTPKSTQTEHNIADKPSLIKPEANTPPASAPPLTTATPPLDLLNAEIIKVNSYTDEQLNEMGEALEKNLKSFNIEAVVKAIQPGPVVTLFEIEPAPGVKVGQIVQLAKDLARSLVVASVRVVEVIPGKSYIGIEIPNNQRESVNFHEVLSSPQFQQQDKPLSMALGKDIGGVPVVVDLAKTPHLLVAGTTGSGKSVGINSMILSLLYKSLPSDVKLILIDPKMLELSVYEGIPHLITPVVTDMSEATAALKWAVAEMERRYKLMSLLGVRNIIGCNDKIAAAEREGTPIRDPMYKPKALYSLEEAEAAPTLEKFPYIVVIIDEFADLIMVIGKQVEELIARIAQKARAAGIHLILATQRPSVNVITGLIKANIPTRLSFQVSTKIDSRTILDQGGAEQLLGLGDMLYSVPGKGVPLRAHGAFVSDAEVHSSVDWLKNNHTPPTYIENLQQQTEQTNSALGLGEKAEGEDELFSTAWEVVFRTKKASISRVQRELRIGYNRAARLIEEMEQQGLLSAPDERGNRTILAGKTEQDDI